MATEIEIGMYVAQNPDVQQHAANTAAASGFTFGTPEYIKVFQDTAVDHAINYGTAEGRVGAQAVATTSPTENNAQAGTSTGGSQTMNFTAPPPSDPVVNTYNVDLTPITSAIGTPGTGQPSTLMGQTQGIREVVDPLGERIQGVRDVVDPLAGQVTGIGTSIGTAGTGQADTLMGQTADIQSGIGQAGEGQTDLFAGQRGIMSGIGTAGEGQTDLFAGQAGLQSGQQAMQANQAGLEAGQLGLGTQIGALGTAAVTGEDGTVTQKPTGLYAGQAGLMSGQTGLGTQLTGVGRDITAELGDVSSTLGGQIGAFQTAAEQYQRGATTQRGDIQGTQRAGQAAMTQQIQGVGQQANRTAEMMAQQRQQPAVQQQAAQFAQSAPRATPSNQQVGPMGPMSVDPRDAIIRQLMANRTGLMNRRPI